MIFQFKQTSKICTMSAMLLAILLYAQNTFAAPLLVGPGQTYSTIQAAINATTAVNNEVVVKAGTYKEHLDFKGLGTFAKSITVRSESGSAVTFIQANTQNTLVTMSGNVTAPTTGIRFEGFTLENGVGTIQDVSAYSSSPNNVSSGGGLYICNLRNSQFRDLVVRNCSAVYGGGAFVRFSGELLFDRCVFNKNSASFVGGAMSFVTSSPLITTLRNCLLTNNIATGYWGGAIDVNYSTVLNLEHTTISDNVSTGSFGGAAIELSNAGIVNCTNSIIYRNGTNAYGFSGGWAGALNVNNSDVEFSSTGAFSSMVVGANVLDKDPLFASNYSLLPLSPCINKGISSTIYEDLVKQCRPISAGPDMGCYEMGSIAPITMTLCAGTTTILTAPSGTNYSWSTGAATQSIKVSAAGTYTVKITNGANCSYAATYIVKTSDSPKVSISGNTTICVGTTTILTATGSGTVTPYTYKWSNGVTTATNTVPTGTYTVTVTDGNGCTGTASVTVTATSPTIDLLSQNVICKGNISYVSINLTVTGGTAPYTYKWSNGAATPNLVNAEVKTANFCVTVTDAKGCQKVRCFDCINPCGTNTLNAVANPSTSPDQPVLPPVKKFGADVELSHRPNPTSQTSFVTYALPNDSEQSEQSARLIIRNTTGVEMANYILTDKKGEIMVDVSRYPSGIYFYSIVSQQGVLINTQKMIVSK